METEKVLRDRACRAGQEHLFQFWDRLDSAGRTELLCHVAQVDFDLVSRLATGAEQAADSGRIERPLEPAAFIPLAEAQSEHGQRARVLGEEALRQGRVAVLVVAGGQGTRLGYPGPKGTLPIGALSRKSLYQLHAEKILATGRRYGRAIRWLVLTSEATHDSSREFFEKHRFFGLDPSLVQFLKQGMLPAISTDGRILMEAPGRLCLSPNGHGGVVEALGSRGVLSELEAEGVDLLYYFQVDNPLARIADPLFLGWHLAQDADMSLKIVRKLRPVEKVGVLVSAGGRQRIVEYSELTSDEAEQRVSDGSLRFKAGSIALHVFDRRFLERIAADPAALPYHRALKKVPYLDSRGRLVRPDEPNAIKFERFVFDALPHARRVVALEVAREEEFSPVKNAEGSESATTSQAAMMALHRSWLRSAGARLSSPEERIRVEISPLFALDAEELRRRIGSNALLVTDGLHLESDGS